MFTSRLPYYAKNTVLHNRNVGSLRAYSDFLKKLPRVGGTNASSNPKKTNRFAEQYSQREQGKQQDKERTQQRNKNREKQNERPNNLNRNRILEEQITRLPKEPNQAKAQQYNFLRNKLKSSQKQEEAKPVAKKPIKKSKPKQREAISIQIPTFITVANLAKILNIPLNSFLKRLQSLGFEDMTHSYILDKENASLIADEYGYKITMNDDTGLDLFSSPDDPAKLQPRAPVVTIMGHVDHGKTTILDYLRKSSIVNQEHGGITQHIGAFSVVTPISKKKITFLDTPGHAAFLKMRERGAIITDIVILVVAADDSVMPQTIEAIKHAKKSNVPIIVAINKCDKQGVNIDKVLSDLARYEIDIEDYGGDTQTVQVSGKTGLNMDKLEEAVITLSELSEFKAEFKGIPSEGWIIESEVVKGLGNVATVLVRRGTVKSGSFLVAGNTYCKVRGMKDEHGKPVKVAGPSTPVQIWGWKELPDAGEQILEAKDEKIAKKVAENRIARAKQIQTGKDIEKINAKRQDEIKELKRQEQLNEMKLAGLKVDDLELAGNAEDKCIQVKYIIKSDVFGSAEAIKESIDGLGNEEVKSLVISHEAGLPTDSDIDLAKALDAKIICFNIKAPKAVQSKAELAGVQITEHNIIYRLIEEVTDELTSHLKPHIELKTVAEADIKDVFTISGKNKTKVKIAGCKISTGLIKRSSNVRVLRDGEVVFTGVLSSLKHVKDDISEAKKGTECGISFEKWDNFEAGDVIEAYEEISHPRYL